MHYFPNDLPVFLLLCLVSLLPFLSVLFVWPTFENTHQSKKTSDAEYAWTRAMRQGLKQLVFEKLKLARHCTSYQRRSFFLGG